MYDRVVEIRMQIEVAEQVIESDVRHANELGSL